jgi:hypothetical protein
MPERTKDVTWLHRLMYLLLPGAETSPTIQICCITELVEKFLHFKMIGFESLTSVRFLQGIRPPLGLEYSCKGLMSRWISKHTDRD